MALEKNTIYLVESDEDPTVLIAIDAQFNGELIEWFDTVRDRAFVVLSKTALPDGLSVVTERATYKLRRLTLELYEAHVLDQVTGHRIFADTEAVQDFYRRFPR